MENSCTQKKKNFLSLQKQHVERDTQVKKRENVRVAQMLL